MSNSINLSTLILSIASTSGQTTHELTVKLPKGIKIHEVQQALREIEGKIVLSEGGTKDDWQATKWSLTDELSGLGGEAAVNRAVALGFVKAPATAKKSTPKPKTTTDGVKAKGPEGKARIRSGSGITFEGDTIEAAVLDAATHFSTKKPIVKFIVHGYGKRVEFLRKNDTERTWRIISQTEGWPLNVTLAESVKLSAIKVPTPKVEKAPKAEKPATTSNTRPAKKNAVRPAPKTTSTKRTKIDKKAISEAAAGK